MARSSSSSKRSSLYADLENLRAQFSSLDPSNTGYIGYQELRTLAQSESGLDEAMVPELLERLDRDKDGKVSFEDLQALFESEREAIKRQKLDNQRSQSHREGLLPTARVTDISSSSQEYDSALDTTPGEIVISPPPQEEKHFLYQTPPVVLRHKKKRSLRLPNSDKYLASDVGFSTISPIQSAGAPASDGQSPAEPDLATQMRYLTSIPESPRLNRRSKVLSWISESEDMFEDTGADREHTDGILSPPMSPVRASGDEAAHVHSILEGVCHAENIGKDAVRQLCGHVQADQQEEQELLALLNHLDKEEKGYVSIDEFVHGLQSMRTTASVATFTPPSSKPNRYNDKPPPRLSEPFSSTPNTARRSLPHYSSTPLLPTQNNALYGSRPQLTVLDPNNSGFIKVESLAQQWQQMGVEPPHNQSLEEALRESLPVDVSRRISVSEVATSLETAVLNDDKNQPTLRQAALLTFKGEISQLRSQLHQVSIERDGLRSNLQRTTEESRRLVQEGDEQVERITQESERKTWENEQRLNERLREVEHEKEDEAKRLQELLDRQSEKHQQEIEELKYNEERLKMELKLTHDEARRKDHLKVESHGGHQSDHAERTETEQDCSDGIKTSIQELEQGNAYLQEENKYLKECNTHLQDKVDELFAENERIKHKYTSQRRKLQRRQSEPHRLKSAPLSATQLDIRRNSRPHSGKRRPSSATRRSTIPGPLPFISEMQKDQDSDSDTLSPTLSPEPHKELCVGGLGGGNKDVEQEGSDGMHTSSSEDGLFAKSTASLMDELQFEDIKAGPEELGTLRQENQELEESIRLLEQQLMHQQDQSDSDKKRLLHSRRLRQEELERRIRILEEQNRRLSIAKKEIDTQLANTEDNLARQLDDIHKLRNTLCTAALTPSDIGVCQTSSDYVTSAETQTSPVEHEREKEDSEEPSQDYQQLVEEMECDLTASMAEKKQQVLVHEKEIERITSEAFNEKRRFLAREDELNRKIVRLGKELQSSQLALEQYKSDAQSLDVQLQKSRQEINTKDRELQLLQCRPQRKILPTLPAQTEEARLREENKNLQINIERKVAELEKLERLQESELQSHASQLAEYEAQFREQECKYQKKLEKAIKDAENTSIAYQTEMEKKLRSTKRRCKIQMEDVQQQLKATQLTVTQMKDKLESAEKQCESLLLDIAQQKDTVSQQAIQIDELQETKLRLEEEMLHIQRDMQKRESKIVQQAEIEQQLHCQLEHMQSHLKVIQGVPIVELATEEVDFPVEALSPVSHITSPSRHSYQSDRSFHEEIVTQMKSQLEDLQMCLIQQHSTSSKSNELTLVQELIETNAVLQANLEREQTERQKELEALEVQDSETQSLAGEVKKHHLELAKFKNVILEKLEQALISLEERANSSLELSSSKVVAASKAIAQLIELMHARQEHQTSALEALTAEQIKSQDNQGVDQSHSTLNYSHGQDSTPIHVNEKMTSDVGFQENEDDGKRKHTERRENETASEIEGLEDEAKRAKQQHREGQTMAETIQRNMQLKEGELRLQIHTKQQEIEDLKNKLQTVVDEPVEVVMQYMETAPLENVSDALFTSMQKELQTASEQRIQLEVQHEAEIEKMKKEIDQYVCEAEELQQQVYALKQAVQEQEAELRSIMEKREIERREKELQDGQNQSRVREQYSELHTAKSAADTLRGQLREVCCQLVSVPLDTEKVNYHDLAETAQSQITTLLGQLSEEQTLRHELELTIGKSQTEWQVQENVWQVEHEEEVRALRQRNSQLSKILEDTRLQYQQYIEEQERENSEVIEDLINKQSSLEKELELKSHDHSSVEDDGYNKREVLLDIIQQLCRELKKPLYVA